MRGWLYHLEKPEGGIFEGEVYAAKARDGWVDTPALLHKKEPAVPIISEPVKAKGKPGRPPKVKE